MRTRPFYRYGTTVMATLLLGLVWLRLFGWPAAEPIAAPEAAIRLPGVVKPARPATPSFDIVRASALGTLVMAGRATPGATVTVLDGETPLGSERANRKGEWVVVPDKPLAPGQHTLYVRADTADGFRELNEQPVVLLIPDRPDLPAVALGGDGRGNIRHGSGVLISAVTRLGADGLYLLGKGPVDAQLIVYCDNLPIGEVVPDERGRWRLATRLALRNGRHNLRADLLSDGVAVASAHAILEIGLPKLVSVDARLDDSIDFENGIPILIEGGGRRLTGRTPGRGPVIRY